MSDKEAFLMERVDWLHGHLRKTSDRAERSRVDYVDLVRAVDEIMQPLHDMTVRQLIMRLENDVINAGLVRDDVSVAEYLRILTDDVR